MADDVKTLWKMHEALLGEVKILKNELNLTKTALREAKERIGKLEERADVGTVRTR